MNDPNSPSSQDIESLLARQHERVSALERQVGRLSAALREAGIALPPLSPDHKPSPQPLGVPQQTDHQVVPAPAGEGEILSPATPEPEDVGQESSAPVIAGAPNAADLPVPPPPPPVEPAPPETGFPAAAMRPFQASPVVLREGDFMTPGEAHAPAGPVGPMLPPPPIRPGAASAPRSGAGLEAALAMRLLPIVGGVLLLFGGVFLASLIGAAMPPGGRVALGYLFAGALGGVAAFAHRKSETVGRLVTAIALAFAYLVSFAAHFIPPTKCLGATASLLLMGAFAAGIVAFAEKWKSEGTAIFAFGLGMLAALLSADVAGGFGLLALVIISVGAGILLVRNEWIRLTIVTLLGCYASYAGLWLLEPPGRSAQALNINFSALLVSHAVFTLAFWRWGRPWVARELAFEQMTEHEAAPRVVFGLIPYSTAYSIINSLGFIGLALYLAWITNTNSGGADKLFYTLAVIEGARLLVPALRRGGLHSFHGLTAIALATSGLMVTFAGNTEAAMLASECLILCIAASRAPMLRILRPFSAICGLLAAKEVAYAGVTGADLATALVPGILVLLSTIAWDSIFVRIVKAPEMGLLFQFERISSNVRALTALGMLAGVLAGHSSVVELTISAPLGSALLGALALLLRARPWTIAFHIAMIFTLGAFSEGEMTGQRLVLFATWGGIVSLIAAETARRTRSRLGALEGFAATALAAMGMFGVATHALDNLVPYLGAAALLVGAALAAGSASVLFVPAFPAIVQDRFAEVPSLTQGIREPLRVLFMNPGAGMAAGVLVVSAAAASFQDAPQSLVSAGLFTLLFAGSWFAFCSRAHRSPVAEAILSGLLLAVLCPAVMVHLLFTSFSLVCVLAIVCLVGGAAIWRDSATSSGIAGLALAMIPLAPHAMGSIPGREVEFLPGPAIGVVLACVVLSRMIRNLAPRLGLVEVWAQLPAFLAGWLVVSGSLGFLTLTASGGTLSATIVTVAWAGYGIALLVAGLMLSDTPMRLTSLAIFAFAVGRVFMVDLANANLMVKAVAATGVGVVLILAGVGYGVFRRRMQESPEGESPEPSNPQDPGTP